MFFMNHAESRTRVCNDVDDCPEYESVKSPIKDRFDILTAAGVPQATAATNTFARQPSCKGSDHLQLVKIAMQQS